MFQRVVIAFSFFTGGLLAISWVMEGSGYASPKNPAWQLVSALRHGILVAIAAVAVLAVAFFIFELIEAYMRHRHQSAESREQRLKSIEDRLRSIERSADREEDALKRHSKLESQIDRKIDHILRQIVELEPKEDPETVEEKALNEFGGEN